MPAWTPLRAAILRDRPNCYWTCDGPTVPVGIAETLTASGSPGYNTRVVMPGDAACVDLGGVAYFIGPQFSGNLSNIHAGASGAMTLECVIRPDQLLAAGIIIGKGSSSNYEYTVLTDTPGTLVFIVYTSAGSNVMVVTSATSAITVGEVHHIVCTYDRAKPYMAVYVNGGLMGDSASASSTSSAASAGFQIGHRQDGGGTTYDGGIGHLAIYGYALSPSRVVAHYNAFRHFGPFGRRRRR